MSLTPYQSVIRFYRQNSLAFGWTPSEIDDQDLEILFDYVIDGLLGDQSGQGDVLEDLMKW